MTVDYARPEDDIEVRLECSQCRDGVICYVFNEESDWCPLYDDVVPKWRIEDIW